MNIIQVITGDENELNLFLTRKQQLYIGIEISPVKDYR